MRNYLIIGASSGIGKQLARQLASAGNQVYGTYLRHEEKDSDNLQYFSLDARNDTFDLNFLPEVLDGLVYCPGSISLKPFSRISADEYIQDYELQVLGAVRIISKALDRLQKSKNASIVLFSTVAVQCGFPYHSLVASSKGAVEGLTRALAAELAPNIRVNCIAPSLTDTPLASVLLGNDEKKQAHGKRHPLRRVGEADDIAQMAEFLLSEKSNWITGQIIHVDGGMSSVRS
ncbi:MAG: SDR family oxidoreductase [Cytophagales bacterium]|nr:SDR family oxidoreductase [Cytophagales bacterium]